MNRQRGRLYVMDQKELDKKKRKAESNRRWLERCPKEKRRDIQKRYTDKNKKKLMHNTRLWNLRRLGMTISYHKKVSA